MFWQEEEPQTQPVIEQTVVDLSFDMQCKTLPVDHAYALSQQIQQVLPWFADEPYTGLHLIHGAESGNGWQRPETEDSLLYLSRRTKLILRLPTHRATDAQVLSGKQLQVAGYTMKIGQASEKALQPSNVLFARHVLAESAQSEEEFLQSMMAAISTMAIQCRKALCGKTHYLHTPEKSLFTRSLMLAELSPQDSIMLQVQGLGKGRELGLGMFVPHKDIAPVSGKNDSQTR